VRRQCPWKCVSVGVERICEELLAFLSFKVRAFGVLIFLIPRDLKIGHEIENF